MTFSECQKNGYKNRHGYKNRRYTNRHGLYSGNKPRGDPWG